MNNDTSIVNERFEKWRELFPEAKTWEYPFWLRAKIAALVKAERWDIVTSLHGGAIIDQKAFTKYVLQQEKNDE